jgi:hypothetical protein
LQDVVAEALSVKLGEAREMVAAGHFLSVFAAQRASACVSRVLDRIGFALQEYLQVNLLAHERPISLHCSRTRSEALQKSICATGRVFLPWSGVSLLRRTSVSVYTS